MGSRTGRETTGDTALAPPSKGVVRDYVETILICVIFVLFTRAFVFQQSKIPSGSMMDTLLIGDYIMVNRFVYAPTSYDWESNLLPLRTIRRGDVIVFKYPIEPEVDYIKRVIGLPGDTVEIRRGYVYVNGELLDEPYVNEAYRQREMLTPLVVQPDHYFVMGDHRDSSADSRVWGQVPRSLIKGRALLIWWSYTDQPGDINLRGTDRLKSIATKLVTFPWRSRWSRCFDLIR